jgi:hypothetical protein
MSEPDNEIQDLEQPVAELTPEQAEAVSGGASADYYLKIEGVPGESKATTPPPPPRTGSGLTKSGLGTLT